MGKTAKYSLEEQQYKIHTINKISNYNISPDTSVLNKQYLPPNRNSHRTRYLSEQGSASNGSEQSPFKGPTNFYELPPTIDAINVLSRPTVKPVFI